MHARLAALSRCEVLLWTSAAACWGWAASATVVHVSTRHWTIAVVAAVVVTQGAIYASCVARRLDGMYKAMLIATTQPTQDGGRHRLSLVKTGTGPHRIP